MHKSSLLFVSWSAFVYITFSFSPGSFLVLLSGSQAVPEPPLCPWSTLSWTVLLSGASGAAMVKAACCSDVFADLTTPSACSVGEAITVAASEDEPSFCSGHPAVRRLSSGISRMIFPLRITRFSSPASRRLASSSLSFLPSSLFLHVRSGVI